MIDSLAGRLSNVRETDITSILVRSLEITNAHKKLPKPLPFHGDSTARIIAGGEEAALIRVRHEQMKSPSSLVVTTGGMRRSAHVAKSSMAQAQFLRPIPGKYSRASRKHRQRAAQLTTFMTRIRKSLKAYAILWQKLYACFSQHTLDLGNRVQVPA